MRKYLSLGIFLAAVAFGVILFAASFLALWLTRPEPIFGGISTIIVNVIPVPTATLPIPTPANTPTPETTVVPTPLPGVIGIGAFVQITGTGEDGLRLRTSPGLEGAIIAIAIEAEVFQVKEGPTDKDGYIWWYLVAPYDETRQGWAASNYLAVIQNP